MKVRIKFHEIVKFLKVPGVLNYFVSSEGYVCSVIVTVHTCSCIL